MKKTVILLLFLAGGFCCWGDPPGEGERVAIGQPTIFWHNGEWQTYKKGVWTPYFRSANDSARSVESATSPQAPSKERGRTIGIGRTTIGIGQPNTGMGRTTIGIGQPNTSIGQTTIGIGRPNTGIGQTTIGMGQPNAVIRQTTIGIGRPNSGIGEQTESSRNHKPR